MKEKLLIELKDAMKQKDTLKKDTITGLRAAILQVEKDGQKELKEDELLAVVSKEVKKRKDVISDYEKANRLDIVENLKREIEILEEYLPEQLTNEEIVELINEAINELNASKISDMGKVMQALKPKIAGKADAKIVSEKIREILK